MPYIKQKDGRRKALRKGDVALSAGELNYQIFYYVKHHKYILACAIIHFVEYFLGIDPNYQKYNDMTGCLIRCYREIERRLNRQAKVLLEILDHYDGEIAKYEDMKIESNGDVE